MPTTYAIPDGRTVMAATLYTGNGSTQSISNAVNGVSFQPDWVWAKSRSTTDANFVLDSVRGATINLYTNGTAAEFTQNTVTAFNSGGFSVGSQVNGVNTNAATYVAWQWKAGTTSASNTNGTITSTVSAGATQGFSVATYTGNGSAGATFGHGLGVAPSFVIIKERGNVNGWLCYHISTGNTGYLELDATLSFQTLSTFLNNTTPSSSVVTLGTVSNVNRNGGTFVAYCFAPVAGYSAFGSFTGNGSADGPFVYTGFRPAFVMAKLSSATGDWNIVDDMRQTYNDASGNPVLRANLSSAEEDVDTMQGQMDILSNGFKLRSNNSSLNASGGTIIYAAFAKSPFKYANAR